MKSVQAVLPESQQRVLLILDNTQARPILHRNLPGFEEAFNRLKGSLELTVRWTEKEMGNSSKESVAKSYFVNPQNKDITYIIFLNIKYNDKFIYFYPTLFIKDKLTDIHYLPTGVLKIGADGIPPTYINWVIGIGNHILELVRSSRTKTSIYLTESLTTSPDAAGIQLAVILVDDLNSAEDLQKLYYISLIGEGQVIDHCNNNNCIVIVGTTKRDLIRLQLFNKPLKASPYEIASFPSTNLQIPQDVITKAKLALK
jgi:hypothetical protein